MTVPREQGQTPDDASRREGWSPATAALTAGAALVALGLFVVTDGGPLLLGWIVFAAGLALLLVGAVAQGVAWGLALHRARAGDA